MSTFLSQFSTACDIELGGALQDFSAASESIWSKQWKLHKHATHTRVRQLFPPSIYYSYFKFAVVRNPYARTFSSYHFGKRNGAFNGAFNEMSFDEYIESDYFHQLKLQGSQSQAKFLNPIRQLDYIGRLEEIEDVIGFLNSAIGKNSHHEPIQHLNRSTAHDEWRTIDSGTRKRISQVLANDFEELGYSTEDGSIIDNFKFKKS